MSKVKTCPFCGNDSIECHPNEIAFAGCNMAGASSADLHYTHCNGCGAEGPDANSYAEAIELHNRRPVSETERVLRNAMIELAAPWDSGPTTLGLVLPLINAEFQRRLNIAGTALFVIQEEVDTSDIPEVPATFFDQAKLLLPAESDAVRAAKRSADIWRNLNPKLRSPTAQVAIVLADEVERLRAIINGEKNG